MHLERSRPRRSGPIAERPARPMGARRESRRCDDDGLRPAERRRLVNSRAGYHAGGGAGAMSGKTILVLGGGVGGLVAVNELRRRLPAEHRVVLIERNARHAFAPSLLWLMLCDTPPPHISFL